MFYFYICKGQHFPCFPVFTLAALLQKLQINFH